MDIGGNSSSEGPEFEFFHLIIDGHIFTLIVVKFMLIFV